VNTAPPASGNRIRLLPEHVANQIAAGEVVERPASVVKELVENALDAEATRITVEIQAGGRSLIRVSDDGLGMGRDDALLCLERHATSKIRTAEDLSALVTMGFRGEALPSIASVCRLTLTTRERHGAAPGATQIIIHGGRILEVREAGAPTGTTLEARSLFFNLPARRKFLRSDETESAHIQHYLTLAALSHPEIGFTFIKDGRTVWQLPPLRIEERVLTRHDALRERLRSLLGGETRLVAIDFSAPLPRAHDPGTPGEPDPAAPLPGDAGAAEGTDAPPRLHLWGFIGAPGVSRSTREDQHLFVNRRPVENRGLNFALVEGYHTALMKGQFPVCCLFLEIDPALVDVNIHPSKREVKFHHERAIRQLTAQAVREALLRFSAPVASHIQLVAAGAPVPTPPATPAPPAALAPIPAAPPAPAPAGPAPAVTSSELPGLAPTAGASTARAASTGPAAIRPAAAAPPVAGATLPPAREDAVVPPSPAVPAAVLPARAPDAQPLLHVPLRVVGVVGRLYVVLESDRGLVLMDQHAAHERILFEQMLARLETGTVPTQRLLLPETVELSPRDAQFTRDHMETLNRLGVSLSEFGERTYLLDGLPPMVKAPDARRFVLELLDELKAAGQQVNAQRLGEHTIAKTVCRHAVKANDPLKGPELENLVADLRRCAMPYTCPHGRPTLIEMSYRELEKKFGRTV
jgi:DNA mismatch repair protein MutL